MDEPIDVKCHRCGREFTTRASTRTTCRNCRAAVTVRRYGESPSHDSDSPITMTTGIGAVLTLLFVGWCIWRGGTEGVGD
jgi:hypothetical protein